MKRITLKETILPDKSSVYVRDKKYCVFLGNELRRFFTNKKHLRTFLVQTNEFLNYKMHELNYLYGIVFAEYRRAWFYFTADHPVAKNNFERMERSIRDEMNQVVKSFDWLARNSGFTNGNYLTFKHLYLICDNLVSIVEVLKQVQHLRRYFVEIHRLEIFRTQSLRIKESIENYGKTDTNTIPEEIVIKEYLAEQPANDPGDGVFSLKKPGHRPLSSHRL